MQRHDITPLLQAILEVSESCAAVYKLGMFSNDKDYIIRIINKHVIPLLNFPGFIRSILYC